MLMQQIEHMCLQQLLYTSEDDRNGKTVFSNMGYKDKVAAPTKRINVRCMIRFF